MTEECNHIQMFQELVNRIGLDVPGMRPLFRLASPLIGVAGGYAHVILMIGILGGEEPIDHYHKQLLRSGAALPPLMQRVMEIHMAEEARHISFAAEFLKVHIPRMNPAGQAICALAFPLAMRWLAGEIMTSPRELQREFGIPQDVWQEAFWHGDHARRVMASYFGDMRALAEDLGLMNRVTRKLWSILGIAGEPSRYRGEPHRGAVTVS
jgi:hypothetical protein